MPMPLVFFDSVLTVLSSLPFQSTRHALSVFCSPIQRPSGARAIAFGYPSGLLNSVVVLALRIGSDAAPRPAGAGACACVNRAPARPAPMVARNARRPVSIAAVLSLESNVGKPARLYGGEVVRDAF